MKVIIEIELATGGRTGVTELLARLHLLRNSHAVQPFLIKDDAGKTVADVSVEIRWTGAGTLRRGLGRFAMRRTTRPRKASAGLFRCRRGRRDEHFIKTFVQSSAACF